MRLPVVSATMSNRRASLLATTALLSAAILSGCGLISSLPGFGGGSAPGAIDPGAPVAPGAPGAVNPGPPGIPIDPPLLPIQLPDDPTVVIVHPGQVGLREVSPVELRAILRDGHAIVRVRWWGGIEPCEVLDSVDVRREGSTFTITARVGSAPGGQVACIEIARDTATFVDLGVLGPGQYTIRASKGDARPVTLTIPEPGAAPS
jgi:hypothetical protein